MFVSRLLTGLDANSEIETAFLKPPRLQDEAGKERTAGFEFEFSSVELEKIVQIVHETFGGEVEKRSTYEYKIHNAAYGSFTVEIDSGVLTKKKYQKPLEQLGLMEKDKSSDLWERSLMGLFSSIVPFEIATPPIPLTELSHLGKLESELRKAGAVGTRAGILYAFGLHINPRVVSPRVEDLVRYVQAFLLLQPWIQKRTQVDLARRVSPFIAPYPKEYEKKVLDPAYKPTMTQCIDDYLEHNASRNRALDLLPLLAHFDEKRVRAAVGEEHKVNPRPCFHYRLPNCDIDGPGWTFAKEWNTWVVVERLAEDVELLPELLTQYCDHSLSQPPLFGDSWAKRFESLLEKAA